MVITTKGDFYETFPHSAFPWNHRTEFETMKELHSMRSSFFFKNGTIFHTGDLIHEIGIIESGSVNIENIDLLGNKSI